MLFGRVKCGEILWRLKTLIDWLGSGPDLVGGLGLGVQVSAIFRFFCILHVRTSADPHICIILLTAAKHGVIAMCNIIIKSGC